ARTGSASDRLIDGRVRVHTGPRRRPSPRPSAHDYDRISEPRPVPRNRDVLPVRLHPRALAHDGRGVARSDSRAVAADRRPPRLSVPPPSGEDESSQALTVVACAARRIPPRGACRTLSRLRVFGLALL